MQLETGHIITLIGILVVQGLGIGAILYRSGFQMGVLTQRIIHLEEQIRHFVRDEALSPQLAADEKRIERLEQQAERNKED